MECTENEQTHFTAANVVTIKQEKDDDYEMVIMEQGNEEHNFTQEYEMPIEEDCLECAQDPFQTAVEEGCIEYEEQDPLSTNTEYCNSEDDMELRNIYIENDWNLNLNKSNEEHKECMSEETRKKKSSLRNIRIMKNPIDLNDSYDIYQDDISKEHPLNLSESYDVHKNIVNISEEPERKNQSLRNIRIKKDPISSNCVEENALEEPVVKSEPEERANQNSERIHRIMKMVFTDEDISEDKGDDGPLQDSKIDKYINMWKVMYPEVDAQGIEANETRDAIINVPVETVTRNSIRSHSDNNGNDSPVNGVSIDKYLRMWKVLYPFVDPQVQRNVYELNNRNVRQTMTELKQLNKDKTPKIQDLIALESVALRPSSGNIMAKNTEDVVKSEPEEEAYQSCESVSDNNEDYGYDSSLQDDINNEDSNEDNGDDNESPLQDDTIDKYLKMWSVLYPKVDVQEQRNLYQQNRGNVRQTMNELRLLNEKRTKLIKKLKKPPEVRRFLDGTSYYSGESSTMANRKRKIRDANRGRRCENEIRNTKLPYSLMERISDANVMIKNSEDTRQEMKLPYSIDVENETTKEDLAQSQDKMKLLEYPEASATLRVWQHSTGGRTDAGYIVCMRDTESSKPSKVYKRSSCKSDSYQLLENVPCSKKRPVPHIKKEKEKIKVRPKMELSGPEKIVLPNGWMRQVVFRKNIENPTSKKKYDKYFYSPQGKKFRSVNEIKYWCMENDIEMDLSVFLMNSKVVQCSPEKKPASTVSQEEKSFSSESQEDKTTSIESQQKEHSEASQLTTSYNEKLCDSSVNTGKDLPREVAVESVQFLDSVRLGENAEKAALVKNKPDEETLVKKEPEDAIQNRERISIDSNEDNDDDSPLYNVRIDKYLKMWKSLYPKVDVQEQINIFQENKGNVRQTMDKMHLLNEERNKKILIDKDCVKPEQDPLAMNAEYSNSEDDMKQMSIYLENNLNIEQMALECENLNKESKEISSEPKKQKNCLRNIRKIDKNIKTFKLAESYSNGQRIVIALPHKTYTFTQGFQNKGTNDDFAVSQSTDLFIREGFQNQDTKDIVTQSQGTECGVLSQQKNKKKSEYQKKYGKEDVPKGWRKQVVMRKDGLTAGNYDIYYISPKGKKLRSRVEVAKHCQQHGFKIDLSQIRFSYHKEHSNGIEVPAKKRGRPKGSTKAKKEQPGCPNGSTKAKEEKRGRPKGSTKAKKEKGGVKRNWSEDPEFRKWLSQDNRGSYICRPCNKTLDLCIKRHQFRSHSLSQKHQILTEEYLKEHQNMLTNAPPPQADMRLQLLPQDMVPPPLTQADMGLQLLQDVVPPPPPQADMGLQVIPPQTPGGGASPSKFRKRSGKRLSKKKLARMANAARWQRNQS